MGLRVVSKDSGGSGGPPGHLSTRAKTFWRQTTAEFALEPHQLKLLGVACDAWDRQEQARAAIDMQGLLVDDRYGTPKPHPLIAVERDARVVFMRALRELALEEEPAADARVPRVRGRR